MGAITGYGDARVTLLDVNGGTDLTPANQFDDVHRLSALGLIKQALVNIDMDNIVSSGGAVSSIPNSGSGGSDYDLDVIVGTGANLKPHPAGSCLFYGASGDYASMPDSSAVSITSSCTFYIYVAPDDWTPVADQDLIAKWELTGNNLSYIVRLDTTGVIQFLTSSDGSAGTLVTSQSTVPTGLTNTEGFWLRVIFDDAANTTNFATSADPRSTYPTSVNFTPLGDPNIAHVTAGIFDGTATLNIGAGRDAGTQAPTVGYIGRAQIYDDTGVGLAADFNPLDAGNTGATSFSSASTGETWTLNGNTFIQNTGHQVAHSIGSVGIETTAGQSIANPFTVFAVGRFSDTSPADDQYLFSSRNRS